MKRFNSAFALGLCVLAAALLAACGGGGSSSSSGGSESSDGPAPTSATVGLAQQVASVNPNKGISQESYVAMGLLGGTLTQLLSDGSGIEPGLAASWEESKDGLTQTYQLRDGLKFSDGSPLDSEDVKASIDHILNDEASILAGQVEPLESVSAPNPKTVVIKLNRPYPSFPEVLGSPVYGIFPADKVDTEAFYQHPSVTAGLYTMKNSVGNGTKLEFEANPEYYGPKAAVKQLDLVAIPDPNTRLAQLKSGQIDVADSLPPNTLNQLSGDTSSYYSTTPTGGMYLIMNNREGPLSDPNVRKAISMAIDRDQINEVVYGGGNKPLFGYFGTESAQYEAVLPEGPDVEGAKELLKGTECANGCKLEDLVQSGRDDFRQIGLIIQQNLAEIGIDAPLRTVDSATAETELYEGEFELGVSGLLDNIDIPDNIIQFGLQSDGGLFALYSGYESKEMDAAIKRTKETSGAEREEAIAEINKLFGEEVPYVPLVNFVLATGTRVPQDVVGLQPNFFYDVEREG